MKENLLCAFCAKSFRPREILRFFAERKLKENSMACAQPARSLVGQALPDNSKKHAAFSLVEMLMALLVASLLLAALAPVMTKRMDETKINISGVGAAQYDKDSLISIYTGAPDEDKIFNVPSDVNMIKATLIGGGGAGGNSFYGKDEITTSKSWTVPEGVTKLRVFMLGGGGGGASGGLGSGTAYGDIPATTASETCKEFKGAGDKGSMTIPSNVSWIAPALNDACKASGETKWTLVSNPTITYEPGKEAGAELKVTACGGGGGGGAGASGIGGGGGTGGYVVNIPVISNSSSIYIKVGGGGGGGARGTENASSAGAYGAGGGGGSTHGTSAGKAASSGGTYGGAGGSGGPGKSAAAGSDGTGTTLSYGGGGGKTSSTYYGGNGGRGGIWGGGGGGGGACTSGGYSYAGGGGGGPTTISTVSGTDTSKIIFQIGGGGGSGGAANNCGGGGGGGGGGYGAGGGGGGGGIGGGGVGGTNATFISSMIGIGNGINGKYGEGVESGGGGGGGGGYGGNSGLDAGNASAGTISNIFGTSYCNGGDGGNSSAGSPGKPGAIRICYGTSLKKENALKCDFSLPANGSGGGGGGQLVVGEINVTPGETLYFEVGSGGTVQSIAGKNGNNGNPTRIRRGGPSGTVIVEALGGLAGHYSSAETTESQGGTYRTNLAIGTGNTLDNNWTGVKYNATSGAGSNGKLATALLNKAYGGAGGSSQNMKGEILQGGVGGNSVKNGASPDIKAYGAGGGGGSGSQSEGDSTFGVGAGGASGYIYFEYGGSNGGGGTTGEMITKIITNIKGGTELKINIGNGGDNATGDGNGKATTIEYTTSGTKTLTAKGGIRGNDGLIKDTHAAEQPLPDNFANKNEASAKGGAGEALHGGIGGYIEHLYENEDGTWATYIKAKDGTVGGPVLGGCGGNLTALTGAILCNGTDSTPNGKDGVFGGGGGGGAVINEVGGLGGRGGKGMVILEYKAVGL